MILDAFPKTNAEAIMDRSVMLIHEHLELIEEALNIDPKLVVLDLPFITLFRRRIAALEFKCMTYDKELQDLEKLTHIGKV